MIKNIIPISKLFLSMISLLSLASNLHAQDTADDRGILAKALFSKDYANVTGVDVRGWVSGSGNWNPDTSGGEFNGPVTFSDRADRVQLDQFYFITERKVSTDDWSLGGAHRLYLRNGLSIHNLKRF